MSNKHITIKELNNEGLYDTLYPNTSATQVPLSNATSQLFGQTGLNTDAALYKIIEKLRADKKITVRVTDSNGNPVQGAKINGLLNSPTTSANGIVTGVFVSDPLTIISPYVDIQNGTANGADYVGTINVLEVVLQSVADGTEIQYTSSTTVAFSQNVDNIDICCVGGGGGGCGLHTDGYSMAAPGGGGGGIVNAMGVTPTTTVKYTVTIGAGGDKGVTSTSGGYSINHGITGGTTSVGNLCVANGGGGGGINKITSGKWVGYPAGGVAGSTGSGTGGDYEDVRASTGKQADPPPPPYGNNGTANTTLSKFNEGQVFYSGGGGSGAAYGGSPNGSNGGNLSPITPNYGGGGGGDLYFYHMWSDTFGTWIDESPYPGSKGGPGLVVIRIHLK